MFYFDLDCEIPDLPSKSGNVCISMEYLKANYIYTFIAIGKTEIQTGVGQIEVVADAKISPKIEIRSHFLICYSIVNLHNIGVCFSRR